MTQYAFGNNPSTSIRLFKNEILGLILGIFDILVPFSTTNNITVKISPIVLEIQSVCLKPISIGGPYCVMNSRKKIAHKIQFLLGLGNVLNYFPRLLQIKIEGKNISTHRFDSNNSQV